MEVIRSEYTFRLLLNMHLPKGVWGSQIPGPGGRLFEVGVGWGGRGHKDRVGKNPCSSGSWELNCGSPPAKMSQAQSEFWKLIHPMVTVAIATASL